MVPTILFTWFTLVDHRLVSDSPSSGPCRPPSDIYEKYDSYFEVIMSGICSTVILLTLGCLLLRNVRQVAQRRFTLSVIGLPIININQSFLAIPSYLPFGA